MNGNTQYTVLTERPPPGRRKETICTRLELLLSLCIFLDIALALVAASEVDISIFLAHFSATGWGTYRLGWTTADVCVVSCLKGLPLSSVLAQLRYSQPSSRRLRKYGQVCYLVCLVCLVYFSSKCIGRLVSFHPPDNAPKTFWFWLQLGGGASFTFLEWFLLRKVLRTALEAAYNSIELSESKPDLNAGINASLGAKKKYRADLWPSESAWLDGKTGEDDEDEDDEEEERATTNGGEEVNASPKKSKKASILQLIYMSRDDCGLLVVAFTALIIAAIGQAFIPQLTGDIINSVASNHDEGLLESSCTQLVAAAIITGVFSAMRGSLFTLQGTRLNIRVREALLTALIAQELNYFDVTKTGKITSRLNADTTKMADQISLNLNVFLRSVVQAVLILIFMFRISVELTFVAFISVPAVVYISIVYGGFYRKLSKACQSKLANANAVSDAAISSMATVKYFASEVSEIEQYMTKMQTFYIVNKRSALIYSAYAMCFTALPTLVSALVLFYGGRLVFQDKFTAGALVSFMLYQQSLSASFSTIGNIYSGLAGALGSADKVFELINRKPRGKPIGTYSPTLPDFCGKIEFSNVFFRYPSRKESLVLNGFNLSIDPGEVIALVGPSGGGKSSVLNLLERLYHPERGSITLDGRQIDEYDHNSFHRIVGIVGQEPILFARTIAENIAYGYPSNECPSQEEIEDAARQANAHHFICSFPGGYSTKCGEKGVMLSGGQKQRIAIARALVRKPHVLLLDEATSALDAESEAIVQKALDKIMTDGRRTVIVVAHRLSTIRNAHRIAVIKEGNICEIGSHRELLKKEDGVYKQLISKQSHA